VPTCAEDATVLVEGPHDRLKDLRELIRSVGDKNE